MNMTIIKQPDFGERIKINSYKDGCYFFEIPPSELATQISPMITNVSKLSL